MTPIRSQVIVICFWLIIFNARVLAFHPVPQPAASDSPPTSYATHGARIEVSALLHTSLAAAVASARSSIVELNVTSPQSLTEDLTVPPNVRLVIDGRGQIAGSAKLTIRGPFSAHLQQVFESGLTVSFEGNRLVQNLAPEWWGAAGNKTSDDSVALQAAFDAAATSANKPAVLLRGVSYKCRTGLSVNTGKPFRMRGVGYQSELFFENGDGIASGIGINKPASVDLGYFRITGSGVIPSLSRGITIVGGGHVKIHNVSVGGVNKPPKDGPLAGIETVNSGDLWVTECEFTNNGVTNPVLNSSFDLVNYPARSQPEGVHFRRNRVHDSHCAISIAIFDAAYSDILDNYVDQNNELASPGTNNGYGILAYSGNFDCHHIMVAGNKVENSAGCGIYFAAVRDAVVRNNILRRNALRETDAGLPVAGISLNGIAHTIIADNRVIDSGKQGIITATGSFNRILRNFIEHPALDGIWLRGENSDTSVIANIIDKPGGTGIYNNASVARNKITGNTIKSAGREGINLGAATYSSVSENIITSATTGGILLGASSVHVRIQGNKIDNLGLVSEAILANGAKHSILNNTISSRSNYGIDVGGATDSIVSRNTVTGCQNGVWLTGGTHNRISDNILEGNTYPVSGSSSTTVVRHNRSTKPHHHAGPNPHHHGI